MSGGVVARQPLAQRPQRQALDLAGALAADAQAGAGLGQPLADPGPLFYPVALGLRSGPAIVLGIVALMTFGVSRRWRSAVGLLVVYLLFFLLALTVVTGIQVVGVLLTSALLVTPAAAAALVTNRLPRMMAIAALIAVGSGVAGIYLSYRHDVSVGAAIVLTCTACFAVAWVVRAMRERTRQILSPLPLRRDRGTE